MGKSWPSICELLGLNRDPISRVTRESIEWQTFASATSFLITVYFWLVKARKEKPNLEFHQLSNFRASLRRHQRDKTKKQLHIFPLDTGGVLVVNHSTRQNSIAMMRCFLRTPKGFLIHGEWGFAGDDKLPWNVGPETCLAISPACTFDVPGDFEEQEDYGFRIEFLTASGKTFSHEFSTKTPLSWQQSDSGKRAA